MSISAKILLFIMEYEDVIAVFLDCLMTLFICYFIIDLLDEAIFQEFKEPEYNVDYSTERLGIVGEWLKSDFERMEAKIVSYGGAVNQSVSLKRLGSLMYDHVLELEDPLYESDGNIVGAIKEYARNHYFNSLKTKEEFALYHEYLNEYCCDIKEELEEIKFKRLQATALMQDESVGFDFEENAIVNY